LVTTSSVTPVSASTASQRIVFKQDKENGLHTDGEGDVEADDAQRAATEPNRLGNHEQVVFDKDNIGGLDGGILFRLYPHCDADANGESRSLVRAVTDHTNAAESAA
jgi:hypothetical protein